VWRETSAEKRELARLSADMVNDVRQAAEVHRQVRARVRARACVGVCGQW
jgi:methionyl aminopeptidase